MESRELTPRELADAIGASESSVRRWVDAGDVRLSRTSGGHRRIPLAEAVRFIRKSRATIVRPDLLGLPKLDRKAVQRSDDETFTEVLRQGDAETARALVLSCFLAGQTTAAIFDGPVRAALQSIGVQWVSDRCGIMVEHRASDICFEILSRLRQLIPAPDGDAPRALGGAVEGDFHGLPSLMAATVLREAGYADINYGANTPVDLLTDAVALHHPKLIWLCASVELPPRRVREMLAPLGKCLKRHRVALVLGGRLADSEVAEIGVDVHRVDSMLSLSGFAGGLRAR